MKVIDTNVLIADFLSGHEHHSNATEHPDHLTFLEKRLQRRNNPSRLVNDAWLAALAEANGATVLSFDKYFR